MPVYLLPITEHDVATFEPAPAVELDFAQPDQSRTRIGGWIDVGYSSGAFGQ